MVNEEVNDEDSGNSRKAREIYRSLSENTQIVSVLAALGKRHWEWEGVVWEDILSALRAYLYDTCTPGELRRLGLGRNLTTEERYWLLRAIWRCRAGLKPVKNVQAHTRLWIGLTQCEQFLDYAPKEQREVIKGIGYLVQHIGHYLTLWIVTSDDQPDALQKFKEQLGTRFQRFIDFELHEKS